MTEPRQAWAVPARRVDAATARGHIFRQHERIRALLGRARTTAELRLSGDVSRPEAVACAIGDIRSVMEIHLAFEEHVLLPILRDDLPIGPQRAEHLLEDHARQRATLAALHQEATAQPQLATLAAKLAFLTTWLLEDMSEEETWLGNPDNLRDDIVVVDQMSG